MQELAEANFVAGRGIEGDRYYLGTGIYSAKPDFREVTVFEMKVLEALVRNDPPVQSGAIKIAPIDHPQSHGARRPLKSPRRTTLPGRHRRPLWRAT